MNVILMEVVPTASLYGLGENPQSGNRFIACNSAS